MDEADTYVMKQPGLEPRGVPTSQAIVRQTGDSWETPGSLLGRRLASCTTVRAIYERLGPDRHALFVILDLDDESTLDLVFDAEQELFRVFPDMAFDLRVMRPGATWDVGALRSSSIAHLERA